MRRMSDDLRPIAEGRHLGLWCRDGWEFARRRQGRGVVAIVALTTDRHLVLIEQHRVPQAVARADRLDVVEVEHLHDRDTIGGHLESVPERPDVGRGLT